jgi:uncharacterized tellurite resistance protein B-like protein
MFERLIKSFGRPANQRDATEIHDHELQLASAMLLFGALPVDYRITADEACALRGALTSLFGFNTDKCQRMIARAAAAHARETSIVAATTLLKHRTPEKFRRQLLAEINLIMRADGVLHDNEVDLEKRIERLLGLAVGHLPQTA